MEPLQKLGGLGYKEFLGLSWVFGAEGCTVSPFRVCGLAGEVLFGGFTRF